MQNPAIEPEGLVDWHALDWRTVNRRVRNLRQRIFKAERMNDHRKVRSLQQLMLRSYSNTLQSVRRVTQYNHGKHTPGVDKVVVTTATGRTALVAASTTASPGKPVQYGGCISQSRMASFARLVSPRLRTASCRRG